MPYIEYSRRAQIAYTLPSHPLMSGEINFIISDIIDQWLGDTISYSSINEAIGVLECVKQELYRRIATPYEDMKMDENGDVYNVRE